ncbi:hypothetical protein MNV49_004997 [Pseudohyphozyma bogoriensis]|nr:hypothetical protein MNV49_004997 [Pseudohyphozyma bogoriensis]
MAQDQPRSLATGASCSFESDALDPRFNPYLVVKARTGGEGEVSKPSNQGGTEASTSAVRIPAVKNPADLLARFEELTKRVAMLEAHTGLVVDHANASISPSSGGEFMVEDALDDTVDASRERLVLASQSLVAPLHTLRNLELTSPATSPAKVGVPTRVEEGILSQEEVEKLFTIYIKNCYQVAPFVDSMDEEMPLATSISIFRNCGSDLLFLAVLTTAARFWLYDDANVTTSWLHPEYHRLVDRLDREFLRITTRPVPGDTSIETVQALLVLIHWQPHDPIPGGQTRSRYSEMSTWNLMGIAIRWAIQLGLESTVSDPFTQPGRIATIEEVRCYRTLIYLVETDYRLAVSARQPATLDPRPALAGVSGRPDHRLGALLQVACATRGAGLHANDLSFKNVSIGTIQSFNADLANIESNYLHPLIESYQAARLDRMSLHFPFTTIRYYRLALSCSLLHSPLAEAPSNLVSLCSDWASQILIHLSLESSKSFTVLELDYASELLTPNPSLVNVMAFSIDHHYTVITYAASWLVLAWFTGSINQRLEIETGASAPSPSPSAPFSPLYRLVQLAADTFHLCSTPVGHTGRSYSKLLKSLAEVVRDGSRRSSPESSQKGDDSQALMDLWTCAGVDPNLFQGDSWADYGFLGESFNDSAGAQMQH